MQRQKQSPTGRRVLRRQRLVAPAEQADQRGGERPAGGIWLNAGNALNGLVVNYVGSTSFSGNTAYFGLYYYNPNTHAISLVASSSNIAALFTATPGWVEGPFQVSSTNTPYTVPTTGLYYLAVLFVGASGIPDITYINGAGSQASQAFSSAYPTSPSRALARCHRPSPAPRRAP